MARCVRTSIRQCTVLGCRGSCLAGREQYEYSGGEDGVGEGILGFRANRVRGCRCVRGSCARNSVSRVDD